jgi:hypothetical protein
LNVTLVRLGLFGLVVLIGWYAVASFSGEGDRVTVCQAMCEPLAVEFWQCHAKGGKLIPTTSLSFKVSIAEQTVFEARELGPYKFTKCKVMDLRNWSCPYTSGALHVLAGSKPDRSPRKTL